MFSFPSCPGVIEMSTSRDGDAGDAGEITIGRRRCRDLARERRVKRDGGIFFLKKRERSIGMGFVWGDLTVCEPSKNE